MEVNKMTDDQMSSIRVEAQDMISEIESDSHKDDVTNLCILSSAMIIRNAINNLTDTLIEVDDTLIQIRNNTNKENI